MIKYISVTILLLLFVLCVQCAHIASNEYKINQNSNEILKNRDFILRTVDALVKQKEEISG